MGKEDDLLARELGKVGKSGAKLWGEILGDSLPEGMAGMAGLGSSLGARWAARFLPTERHQSELKLRADPRMILAKVYSFLCSKGQVKDSDELRDSPYPTVSGVIGSGWFNMNPAVVYVEIIGIKDDTCCVLVSGAAKEGLIKQHTAEKAVNQLVEALTSLGQAEVSTMEADGTPSNPMSDDASERQRSRDDYAREHKNEAGRGSPGGSQAGCALIFLAVVFGACVAVFA